MFIRVILSMFLLTSYINSSFMDSILQYTVQPIQSLWSSKKLKEVVIKNYTLDPKLESYFTVNLDNLSGNVSIKAWNQNQVSIEATKSGSEEELKNSLILVKLDKNNIKIETQKSNQNLKSIAKIDYFIMIPERSNLKLNLINGNVSAKFVLGKLDININNGNAKLKDCDNSVKAKVINGQIKLKQKRFDKKDAIFLETVSGDINLFLPKNIEGVLRAKTLTGKIISHVPISLDSITKKLNNETWEYLKKNVSGHFNLGKSEAPITLESVNGSIFIKEY